jgi:hypothetical protein
MIDMTIPEAWAIIQNYLDAQDDLTDEECEAVDIVAAAMDGSAQ